ncbi:cysteine sulfinic acid decarboxylase [Hemicordylus capensis]|uniref:cysteine sulfinic acid decarboxylase n=1 Tax=Hemicordylus capensis TaxID=884348 RepID=UPI002304A7D9|nr:cysteine sulfinic acid decarboxylase [Hemicordylus capensis]XP_053160010.1 cysteine sulfinic acid decarboxylase [Hemicordylus capensis]XP_053160011.1 cysteine sulfinic acid decarboxylase [Hemicordylus capensis]XP_053160012.1 cysteine sulfinic acid decarboxylase [Hemicordylus capensis]
MAEKDSLSCPALDKVAGEEFLQEAFQIMLQEGIRKGMDASEKVCDWKEPEELQRILDLDLKDNGEPQERLLEHCRDVIRHSVKTCHPRFFNQLFSGLDPHALAGRMITEMLNTSQYTYEIAPVFVLMEVVVLKKLRELIGWESGDGIFCPGGSISNMYAMNVARFHYFPDCKQKGNWAIPKLAIFTSQECHYSMQKGAAFLGIGTDNIYLVAADEKGKMIPVDLEKQINQAKSEGAFPFFVNATCGTTVLGSFDPLTEIAELCARHRIWLHVDAAWGGSALLSRKHRHLLDGIERADSVAWNPHKMLMTGLQCSAFLLRDTSGLLQRCHCAKATYLFQTDKFYNMAYDMGDATIQCGRKVDCLKLWLMWKANGTRGLEQRVNRAFAFTSYMTAEIKKREGFQLVIEPEFINLCFWFVPPSLRGKEKCTDYYVRLGKVAPAIKERMMKKGSMMVSYQPHGSKVNFFRQVVTNPAVTREDLDFFLDEIERLGRDL